jgi:type IV fimbrial biogenesis protein FimT
LLSGGSMQQTKKNQGFTLIELMMTIVILAIITTMAAPSMGNLLEKQRFQKKERDLLSLFTQAKSQAILKRIDVTLDLNSTSGNLDTTLSWYKGSNLTLTINTLSDTQSSGSYSGTSFVFDQNGLVKGLNQDALITLCNSKVKVKKQLILTKLGSIYTKPEGTC